MQAACFWISGSTLKFLLQHVDAAGAAGSRQAELGHPGEERIFVAEEPDTEGLALEVGGGLDAHVVAAGQQQPRPLVGLGDIDQRHALFAGRERCGKPVDDDIGATAGDYRLGRDVGPARLDRYVEAGVGVKTLGLGDVVAGKLRLRDPLGLQRHGIRGIGPTHARCEQRAGHCGSKKLFHRFVFPCCFTPVHHGRTDART